jgi:hypothetical protein
MSELTNIDTKGRFIVGDIIFNINTWWARVHSVIDGVVVLYVYADADLMELNCPDRFDFLRGYTKGCYFALYKNDK